MISLSDFHSHILPGVDDGSQSLRESLALLRMEAEQGVGTVAATPHFYARRDTMEHFLARRRKAAEKLREAMARQGGLPAVVLGAEVHYFRGMGHSEAIRELALEGTDYVLVEMPMGPWEDVMYRELEQISDNLCLTPIIAHVERYLRPLGSGKMLKRLADLPVLVQANGDFFLRKATSGKAMRMLSRGQIQLLGSDCHNLTGRAPNLGQAAQQIQDRLGPEALEWIHAHQRLVLPGSP